jgi:hypothetical protein
MEWWNKPEDGESILDGRLKLMEVRHVRGVCGKIPEQPFDE